MPRPITFTDPVRTTQFSPRQLRPRAVLDLAFNGFARWMEAHLVPFPRLLHAHHRALAVQSLRIDYRAPDPVFADYTDRPRLTARTSVTFSDCGGFAAVELSCAAPGGRGWRDGPGDEGGCPGRDGEGPGAGRHTGREAVRARLIARILELQDAASMSALPGTLPPELRSLLSADGLGPAAGLRSPDLRPDPFGADATPAVLARDWRTSLHRGHCEVADQWSFVEMTELAAQARERLYTVGPPGAPPDTPPPPAALDAVRLPLRALVAVFHRPLFVFDACRVRTTAHTPVPAVGPVYRHEVYADGGGARRDGRPHLRVWELLSEE
ncbi:hypothetical protein [Streptomyces sp. NPDC048659]|uniref:hypothetical protein n=1 Tax=Streptomyces sp. NPDC048659 TaxID=3155489 RepID=UPI00343218F6